MIAAGALAGAIFLILGWFYVGKVMSKEDHHDR